MPKSQRVRKTPQQRRGDIRDAACAIALTEGLNHVTTRAIAPLVEATPGLVSHYVPRINTLRAETFARVAAEELETIKAETASAADSIEAMRILIGTLFIADRDPTTGIWLDAWSLGRRLEVMAEAVREQMHQWQQFVLELIETGRATGQFGVDDTDSAAWQIVSMVDGLNAHSLVQYRGPTERRLLLARSTEHTLGLHNETLSPSVKHISNGGSDENISVAR